MCDYSLCGIPNRLAVDGEELIVHKFSTGSMGLAAPADLKIRESIKEPFPDRSLWARIKRFFACPPQTPAPAAVCIPPGSHLILKNIPADLQQKYNVQCQEGVVFTQTSANVNAYRDAIQFPGGRQVLLQDLQEGMGVEVLSLAGAFLPDEEREPVLGGPSR
jgi:hypothetical protein